MLIVSEYCISISVCLSFRALMDFCAFRHPAIWQNNNSNNVVVVVVITERIFFLLYIKAFVHNPQSINQSIKFISDKSSYLKTK